MKQYPKISLPIDPYLDEIFLKIQESSTILIKASPGSGKTTRLPWFIASRTSSKVLVLEPRRLAAKLAAERIAFEEGFKTGSEVGYHFRFDKNFSEVTRLIFYTEGTFLRKILHDQDLKDVGVVILDEFHERHIETDMALAYLLGLQKRRPELKLILMSATLDTEITKKLLGAQSIDIIAPHYPVETHYLENVPSVLNQTLEAKIRQALEKIKVSGDVLIFLPGMREILKVKDYLGNRYGSVHILHSEITKEEQEDALSLKNGKKIILSTNIAESSVTIPGIVAVIDSGIQREAHYSPWNGLKLITDRSVTKASAIQRAGRAGRTAPGECHRLYSLQDFEGREAFTLPEISRSDLTDTFLLSIELKQELDWITPPPADRWKKARDLCYLMGIISEDGKSTLLTKKISHYPLDTRLSRILMAGESLVHAEKKKLVQYICRELENDQYGVLERRLSSYLQTSGSETFPWEKCLLAGFIDQVAKYRPKQNDFIHYSGKTIKIHPRFGTLSEGLYLILDITQKQEANQLVEIEEEWLFEHEPFPFSEEDILTVDTQFSMKSLTKLGSIVLDEKSVPLKWETFSPNQKQKVLEAATRPFAKHWERWKDTETYNRYHFWAKLEAKDLTALESSLNLKSYLDFSADLNWNLIDGYFKDAFDAFFEIPGLDQLLPWSINLGGRRELKVHYPYNLDPFLEAPIQEFYGLKSTPKIAQNKVLLTLKLVGPHKMPLQITKDLQGFWQKTYLEMKKEFQREYPRHHWPDTPESAPPLLLKRMLPKP